MFRASVRSAQHHRSGWRRLLPGGRGLPPSDVRRAAADIRAVLGRHRRSRWRPWACRCGAPHPCGARLTALDDQLRQAARQACDWYPAYFADQRQPDTEGRRR